MVWLDVSRGGSRGTCPGERVGGWCCMEEDECPFGKPFVDRTAFRLTMRSHPRAFAQVSSLQLGGVAWCGGMHLLVVAERGSKAPGSKYLPRNADIAPDEQWPPLAKLLPSEMKSQFVEELLQRRDSSNIQERSDSIREEFIRRVVRDLPEDPTCTRKDSSQEDQKGTGFFIISCGGVGPVLLYEVRYYYTAGRCRSGTSGSGITIPRDDVAARARSCGSWASCVGLFPDSCSWSQYISTRCVSSWLGSHYWPNLWAT